MWTPEDTLKDSTVVSVRAQRRLLVGQQTSVSDEQLAHVVLGLDQREDFAQADASRLPLLLGGRRINLDRCVHVVHIKLYSLCIFRFNSRQKLIN